MSETVRHELAKLAYNSKTKFAIAITMSNDNVRIINNNNCQHNIDRKLIITDYTTAINLLKYPQNG